MRPFPPDTARKIRGKLGFTVVTAVDGPHAFDAAVARWPGGYRAQRLGHEHVRVVPASTEGDARRDASQRLWMYSFR